MRQTRRWVALLVLALVLAGCGSDGEPDAAPAPVADETAVVTPSPSAVAAVEPEPLPACSSVWKLEKRLPVAYVGCQSGEQKVAKTTNCQNGQVLHLFGNRFYGVPGGPVLRAAGDRSQDSKFAKLYRICTA